MSDVIARIESKIDRSAGPDGCWPWLGAVGQKGGPRTSIRKRAANPRRLLWEHTRGETLPWNRQVSTTCENPRCLNPAHLYLRPWCDDVARFWTYVEKGEGDACWLWTGTRFVRGYGAFPMHPKLVQAHRYSYELAHGVKLTDRSMFVCHRCDVPLCVRPDHLFLGTAADNNADMWSKGRGSRGEKHAAIMRAARQRSGDSSCPTQEKK